MDAAEAVRAQAERDRLRRLMVDGVITVDDMRGDVCMMREYRRYTQKLEKQQLKEGVILPSKARHRQLSLRSLILYWNVY